MAELSEQDAARALQMLDQIGERPVRNGSQGPPNPLSSDEEDDVDFHPIISSLVKQGGSEVFVKNTNFNERLFFQLYEIAREEIETKLQRGRGKSHKSTPIDLFFMMLTCLKRGGTWDDLSFALRKNKSTFEKNMTLMFDICSPIFYKQLVIARRNEWSYEKLFEKHMLFRNNPSAFYATDVRFHQSLRPNGAHLDAKPMFSAKHKLYGVKTEVSVLPNGLCIRSSRHFRGGEADISIFRSALAWHKQFLEKKGSETEIEDETLTDEEFEHLWAVLLDKGYEGLQRELRCIIPGKRPINGRITAAQLLDNQKIAADRVIVERFFGREVMLWAIMERQFKWSQDKYDTISRLCRALTNFHIIHYPMNIRDETEHAAYRNRLYQKGILVAEKRKETQEAYRQRRRQRLNDQWNALPTASPLVPRGDSSDDAEFD